MDSKAPVQIVPAVFEEDKDKIFELVNDCYSVETGNTGVAFKNALRLRDPTQASFKDQYHAGQVLKIELDGRIEGVIFFEYLMDVMAVYFGPFAVRPEVRGRGYGRLLIEAMETRAKLAGMKMTQFVVVNHRTELLAMYTKMGFQRLPEILPYPEPDILTRPSHFVQFEKVL